MHRCWSRSMLLAALLLGAAAPLASADSAASPRTIIPLDDDWRFFKGDAPGSEKPEADERSWRKLDLPHDWSIEGPFDEHAPATGAGAFLPTGIGWYRKHFSLLDADPDNRVLVDFDGVVANSDVWINGFHLGHRPSGYVSFFYDLTGHLNFGPGSSNVLAVKVDDSAQPASRWYGGAGINRDVRLVIVSPCHIDQWGATVNTQLPAPPALPASRPAATTAGTTTQAANSAPVVAPAPATATVQVRNRVVNPGNLPRELSIRITLTDPDGNPAGTADAAPRAVPPNGYADFDASVQVQHPRLWDIDHPALYHVTSQLRDVNLPIDQDTTALGIRSIEFRADTGFWLNGRNLKLQGVCLHYDIGGLGTAVPRAAWIHRLAALKQLGVNAIRTAHAPPPPDLLDAADHLGFVVMDEMFDAWTVAKEPFDYHLYFKDWHEPDLRDTVMRDRNHPCIVLYSAGNEIHDTPHPDVAIPILKQLVGLFHETDPTRPVTQALFRPNVSHDYTDGLADLLDVIGTNYRDSELLAAHAAKPSRKVVGTEEGPSLAAWAAVRDNACYAGQFLWTGADYLGESRHWPNVIHESGLIDITDVPRPLGWQRQSWWTTKPMVAIARDLGRVATHNLPGEPQARDVWAADWTPASFAAHEERVLVFSNCPRVELTINGLSLGTQDAPADQSPRVWKVPFANGTLRAVATDAAGHPLATDELTTAGVASKLLLSVDRSSIAHQRDDVIYATAAIADDRGTLVPAADNVITFHIEGPGAIAAIESTDPNSHESFQSDHRIAYRGRCVAILRATADRGTIKLTATAEGLAASSVVAVTIIGK